MIYPRSLVHLLRAAVREVRIMFGPYPRCPIPGCQARTFDLEIHNATHHSGPTERPRSWKHLYEDQDGTQ